MVDQVVTTTVSPGSWISESALWSRWWHVGTMEAVTSCQLVTVDGETVLQLMQGHDNIASATKNYCINYHTRIISAIPPHASWPTDLYVPYTDFSDMLSQDVGLGLLKGYTRKGSLKLSSSDHAAFKEELQNGKTALVVGADGILERVVAVVAMRLENKGKILVQLAKWDDRTGLKPARVLPGTKRRRGELQSAALTRIINEDLKPWSSGIDLIRSTQDIKVAESKFGVRTKYLRTEHEARLLNEFDTPAELKPVGFVDDTSVPDLGISVSQVYAIRVGHKALLYAWLQPEDFEALVHMPMHSLERWLSHLDLSLMSPRSTPANTSSNPTSKSNSF
mmetsp:Transcript_32711/g.59424  ORF Transcript_32711/g.59424 Transcript_32711/m.59424 type:complete len:336 (+) Transcript_32711:1-1008(+)